MQKAPKALRLHIGFFGRTNVGKSSFLNVISGQDVAITSHIAGTTTDVVEKTMEFLPIGPIVILDTAGVDDTSALSEERLKKTDRVFDRSDVIALVTEPDKWTDFEDGIIDEAKKRDIPIVIVVNKTDVQIPSDKFKELLSQKSEHVIYGDCKIKENAEKFRLEFKQALVEILPEDFIKPPTLLGDLVKKGGIALLVIPIDFEAPKGRIILPQVMAIRDTLDNDAISVIAKETELPLILSQLKVKPDIVICDSQAIEQVAKDTPDDIPLTTFSIIFARLKGDLTEFTKGALAIKNLKDGDNVLISESCSHHPIKDDIGRDKIPKWLKQHTGYDLNIDVTAGKDFPKNLNKYKLVIQCGGCAVNRREVLSRIKYSVSQGVPITNYGTCISYLHTELERVIKPFDTVYKEVFSP